MLRVWILIVFLLLFMSVVLIAVYMAKGGGRGKKGKKCCRRSRGQGSNFVSTDDTNDGEARDEFASALDAVSAMAASATGYEVVQATLRERVRGRPTNPQVGHT